MCDMTHSSVSHTRGMRVKHPCVAVCCSVLQCVAIGVLQCVAVCCSAIHGKCLLSFCVLQCVAMCCNVLQCVVVCCSVCVAVSYSVLQRVVMCCIVLQKCA